MASLALLLVTQLVSSAPCESIDLHDQDGVRHTLNDYRDPPILVVAFVGVDCPLAKLYAPRLAELARTYAKNGVAFVGVGSNEHETAADLARYAHEHNLPFLAWKDERNRLADVFGIERTPAVVVLDAARKMRYRGRIDDQYGVGTRRATPEHQELRAALDDLLAGRPVRVVETKPAGCLIDRRRVTKDGEWPTFCREIAPILQRHCQACHRGDGVAPFPLISYDDAVARADMIGEVVADGRMPPWGANPAHGKFANDPSLSAQQKQVVARWIVAGCPEGDRADLPAPVHFSEGWIAGPPDLVLSMPVEFAVPAQGVVEYQFFEVDPGFTEDRWIRRAEIRPGNRSVVHHCNVYLQPPGYSETHEQGTLGSYCLAAMAQGTPPLDLPVGLAKRIPAGWKLIFVMHYAPNGKPAVDRTSIGLTFADPGTVKQELATRLMLDADLLIPPGDPQHEVSQTWRIGSDVLIHAFFPHMHLRGKSFRYEATYPDGHNEILLDVPRFDFAWQLRYELAEPKRLPVGSLLRCVATYDNSPANPANPDPSRWVRTGVQSWEEMFNGYYEVTLADQDLTQPAPAPHRWSGGYAAGFLLVTLLLLRRQRSS